MNIEQTIVHIHIEIDDSKEKEKHNQTIKTTIKKNKRRKEIEHHCSRSQAVKTRSEGIRG